MTRYLIAILMLASLSLFSQSEEGTRVLSAKCAVQQTMGGTGYWQISITNFSDPGGQVDANAIDTLDYIQFSDSGNPFALQVIGIISAVGNSATVKVSNVGVVGISSVPTTNNAIWSRRTVNFGLTPRMANISANDDQLQQEYTMYKIDSILNSAVGGVDYVTTDSFSTFQGGAIFSDVPVGKTVLRTTTGSKYRKSSLTNMTEVTLGNGLLATTKLTQSAFTLTWNSNLNNRVGLNTGANSSVTITNPTNLTSQTFGETFIVQISTSSIPVTVVFDTLYSKFDFTAFGSVSLSAFTEATYSFRVVKAGNKGYKLACTDDIGTSSGSGGIDTLYSYTNLRAYTGTANAVVVTKQRMKGIFRRTDTGTENGGTLIEATSGVKWQRVFDGKTYSPGWWEIGGYNHSGTSASIINNRDRLNSCVQAAGSGAIIQLEKDTTYLIDIFIDLSKKNLKFEMNGAVVKRFVSPITTLTATESIGSTVLDVASTTGFRVGHRIMITDVSAAHGGRGFDENIGAVSTYAVASLTSNTLTITTGLPIAMAIGDSVFVIPVMFENNTNMDLGILSFENGIFDGNKDNNQHTYDWRFNDNLSLGSVGSENIVFEKCTFQNAPNENIFGTGATFNVCVFKNLMGSIYHQSRVNGIGADTITKQNVSFIECEADSICMGDNVLQSHSEAAFTHSAKTRLFEIIGGRYTNISALIFSGFDAESEFGIKVSGAYFENAEGIMATTISTTDTTVFDVNFNNSQFINCGDWTAVGYDMTTGAAAYRMVVDNCIFVNSRIYWKNFAQSKVTNCNFYTETPFATGTEWAFTGWTSSLTGQENYIQFQDFYELDFSNNKVYGPRYLDTDVYQGVGFHINGSYQTDSRFYKSMNLTCKNNLIHSFGSGIGMFQRSVNYFVGIESTPKNVIGWDISGNTIVSYDTTALPNNAVGILVMPGAVAKNNIIYSRTNSSSYIPLMVFGITDDGSASADSLLGGWAENNIVLGNTTLSGGIGGDTYNRHNVVVINNSYPKAPFQDYVNGLAPFVDATATDDIYGLNKVFTGLVGTITSTTYKRPPYVRWKQSVGYFN